MKSGYWSIVYLHCHCLTSCTYTLLTHKPIYFLQAVYAPRGSLVLWDSRLPHSTSDILEGCDSREVVYMGFLPSTDINEVCVLMLNFYILATSLTKSAAWIIDSAAFVSNLLHSALWPSSVKPWRAISIPHTDPRLESKRTKTGRLMSWRWERGISWASANICHFLLLPRSVIKCTLFLSLHLNEYILVKRPTIAVLTLYYLYIATVMNVEYRWEVRHMSSSGDNTIIVSSHWQVVKEMVTLSWRNKTLCTNHGYILNRQTLT